MTNERFPRGKLRDDDEGTLTFAITVKDRTVILEFGKPIEWIGMSKQDALGLAELLARRANEIKELP